MEKGVVNNFGEDLWIVSFSCAPAGICGLQKCYQAVEEKPRLPSTFWQTPTALCDPLQFTEILCQIKSAGGLITSNSNSSLCGEGWKTSDVVDGTRNGCHRRSAPERAPKPPGSRQRKPPGILASYLSTQKDKFSPDLTPILAALVKKPTPCLIVNIQDVTQGPPCHHHRRRYFSFNSTFLCIDLTNIGITGLIVGQGLKKVWFISKKNCHEF